MNLHRMILVVSLARIGAGVYNIVKKLSWTQILP